MGAFFSGLHFANLAALTLAVALPLLILAYLKKRSRKSRVVSSILILQNLTKRRVVRRRFKPPLRFFLELAALLFLAVAAAMPEIEDRAERVALVLDTSLSMRAQNSSTAEYPTRFEEALAAARSWIEGRDSASLVSLYHSSPKLTRIGAPEMSPSGAIAALDSVSPGLGSDALEAAVDDLAQSGEFAEIAVVTDRPAAYRSEQAQGDKNGRNRTSLEVISVGRPQINPYLGALRYADAIEGNRALIADIGLSASQPLDVTLRAYVENEGRTVAEIGRAQGTAVPGKLVELEIPLPAQESSNAVYRVQLSVEDPSANAIAEDDLAWAAESGTVGNLILLVTPSRSSGPLGLNRIPGARILTVSPREYSVLKPEELSRFSLLVFHQTAPASLPPAPALLVLPPDNNPLFPILLETAQPKITSWADEHPSTSYLKVPLLNPARGAVIDVPGWAQSVINSENGSLLAGGELRGLRFAAVGFEILPFEGARTPATSILTLNLLQWLSGGNQLTSSVLTSSALRLDGGRRWLITSPKGELSEINVPLGKVEFYTADEPGAYRLHGVSTAEGASEALERVVTVNSYFPEESSTYQVAPLSLSREVFSEQVVDKGDEALWNYLLALALLILAGEYLYLILKPSHKEAVYV